MKLQKVVGILSCMWVLLAAFSAAQDEPRPDERSSPLLDVYGKPLTTEKRYYIQPVNRENGGHLTLVTRNKGQNCPKFVGQVANPEENGTPVKLEGNLKEGWDLVIAFEGSTSCPQSAGWSAGREVSWTGHGLIETGPELLAQALFKIVSYNRQYHIVFCPFTNRNCGMVGIEGENGVDLLAIGGPGLPIEFEDVGFSGQ